MIQKIASKKKTTKMEADGDWEDESEKKMLAKRKEDEAREMVIIIISDNA